MVLQDALFNWLQMKIVSDARPDDGAAKETLDFFDIILTEDHHLSEIEVVVEEETKLYIKYTVDGESKKQLFDRERAEQLLTDINSNPKYN
ncbi:hypothetical protein EHS13_13100 [Paenibacillus psychroresistens]|uniref:Uncharacterized protein n=1 Tax=Paenibacillus psychroresistens TaxID=1778678 RepID=A0A6B8RK60_9BACL|nr:hypothetical protein [Paenibacillus psychroresistens]QGQ95748.1 hypothetical protein EHS13_13100 [Paenibacillus psychroresistens]